MYNKGQVWIETVLYTLISIALIGLVLAFVTPKINESRDRLTIEQALGSMQTLDEKILDAAHGSEGNIRNVREFSMRKGKLIINSTGNSIDFIISELNVVYSQPDIPIAFGSVEVLTTEGQRTNTVRLRLKYDFDIVYNGEDELGEFTASTIPYSFSIENRDNKIDIRESSGNFE